MAHNSDAYRFVWWIWGLSVLVLKVETLVDQFYEERWGFSTEFTRRKTFSWTSKAQVQSDHESESGVRVWHVQLILGISPNKTILCVSPGGRKKDVIWLSLQILSPRTLLLFTSTHCCPVFLRVPKKGITKRAHYSTCHSLWAWLSGNNLRWQKAVVRALWKMGQVRKPFQLEETMCESKDS